MKCASELSRPAAPASPTVIECYDGLSPSSIGVRDGRAQRALDRIPATCSSHEHSSDFAHPNSVEHYNDSEITLDQSRMEFLVGTTASAFRVSSSVMEGLLVYTWWIGAGF